MSEVETSAASVAAETITAPVAPAAQAPAAPAAPASSGTSRSLDEKADYLSRIRTATAASSVEADAQASQVIADATDAPVSGDTETEPAATDTPTEEAPGQEEQQPKSYDIPYDKLPDNRRGELKRANLAPEVKEALAQAWYQQKALHDTGFSIDHARQLKAVGFTPEAAIDRIKVHPTVDDARMDAQLANVARQIVSDYQSNPMSMLNGLRENAPEAFPTFAKAFVSEMRSLAPEVYGETVSDAFWTALQIMDNETSADDLDMKEAVARVRTKLFPNASQPRASNALNPNDPIHKKYQEMVQQQQAARQMQASQFQNALVEFSRDAVKTEVAQRLTEAAPGLDPDFVNRAVVDVMSAVERDVMGNRNVVDGVSRLMSSGLTQDDLNKAVGYVLDRARPLMAVHMKSALDFWSKAARPQTQPAPAVSPKPAVKPVAPNAPPTTQRVPGTTPQQTSPVTPPDSFIKEGRAKGWDNLRIMQQWASNRK